MHDGAGVGAKGARGEMHDEEVRDEAERKAQKERMDRLKSLNANRPFESVEDAKMTSATTLSEDAMDVEVSAPHDDQTDAAAQKEEEEYRKKALDYSSGHFAASVKEDKDKKGSQQKKSARGETSSLFNAILRSAQSSSIPLAMDTSENGGEGTTVGSDSAHISNVPQKKQR